MEPVGIYPTFVGRLGNNLFQIAACIGYAQRENVGWGIRKGYRDHGFQMDQVDRFLPWLPACSHTFRAYNEPYFYHQNIPYHSSGVRIVGFWQSKKYWENAEDQVKKWIKVPIVPGYEDYVSIHVRRGDYVQHSNSFPPITADYLYRAMEFHAGANVRKFMFFSDDIEWCKQFMAKGFIYQKKGLNTDLHLTEKDFKIEFSEGRNEFEDLSLMASCGNHIISNSTLAWWGAYLGHNPKKIVVSPHHLNWFGPSNPHRENTFDLLPKEWIQIKFR